MIEYPNIEYWNKGIIGAPIIAFDKLDGQNLRFEWSRKRGWYKFGSRHSMFDETHPEFGKTIQIFLDKYEGGFDNIFRRNRKYRDSRSFVVFCEYLGPNSFCGMHDPNDEMDVVLLDVAVTDETEVRYIEPRDFIRDFGGLGIPKVVYEGNLSKEFVNDIRIGKYDVKEGVMCKGVQTNKGGRRVWIVKAKTNAWMDRLRGKIGEDGLLKELNGDKSLL